MTTKIKKYCTQNLDLPGSLGAQHHVATPMQSDGDDHSMWPECDGLALVLDVAFEAGRAVVGPLMSLGMDVRFGIAPAMGDSESDIELIVFHAANRRNAQVLERLRFARRAKPCSPVVMVTGIRSRSTHLERELTDNYDDIRDSLRAVGLHFIDLTGVDVSVSGSQEDGGVRLFSAAGFA